MLRLRRQTPSCSRIEPRDLAAVGAALGLAHDVSRRSRRSAFMLPPRSFSAASGVGGERAVDDRRRARPRRPSRPRPSRLDDRGRVAALGDEPSSTCAPAPARDLLGRRPSPTSCGQRRRRDLRACRVLVAQARGQLVGDPVGERARLGAVGRRQRRLEVVAELGAEGQQLRGVGAQAELALEPLGARRRQLGQRARARSSISSRRARAGRGRARGSSGSRAPPPWSAAT